MGIVSSLLNNHYCQNSSRSTWLKQKKKSHISSPSVPLTEVITTGDQMKKTLLKIMGISVFEHCWKHLGKYKYIINQKYITRGILLQNSYHMCNYTEKYIEKIMKFKVKDLLSQCSYWPSEHWAWFMVVFGPVWIKFRVGLALSRRDVALSLQQQFANSPLLFVHTEPSSSSVKTHQCVIHTERHCGSKRGVMVHFIMMVSVFMFNAYWYPPVYLNKYPLTVYNHMDAIILCFDLDPDPTCILESDKVTFSALNYIIA